MSSKTRGTVQISATDGIGRSAGRYLLAIHWLSQSGPDRIQTGELRESLDVSAASVTEMVTRLDEQGLVDYEKYEGVRLTRQGEDVATRLAWRFCVVNNFFVSSLNTDLDDETSYDIGMALPEQGIFRLREIADHPCIESCPETRQRYNGCQL